MGGRGAYSSGTDRDNNDQPDSQRDDWTDDEVEDWLDDNATETKLVINPVTGEEYECYTVTIHGYPVYFTDKGKALTAIKGILNSGKLPDILMQGIDGIMLVPDQLPGRPEVIAKERDGIIIVFGNRAVDAGIIAHEAAHTLAEARWGSASPPVGSDYLTAVQSDEPAVSEYGRTSPSEDFSEAIRMYVTNPAKLRRIAPRRYRIIRRMLESRTYHG